MDPGWYPTFNIGKKKEERENKIGSPTLLK
jgi:hypothetical protein